MLLCPPSAKGTAVKEYSHSVCPKGTPLTLVPPGVCGPWPLLVVWDLQSSWAHRQPATRAWSVLECAALAAPRNARPRFPLKLLCTFGLSWSVRLLAAPRGANNTGLSVWWDNRRHSRHALLVFIANRPAPCLHRQWNRRRQFLRHANW